jgi:hypothetical protein
MLRRSSDPGRQRASVIQPAQGMERHSWNYILVLVPTQAELAILDRVGGDQPMRRSLPMPGRNGEWQMACR